MKAIPVELSELQPYLVDVKWETYEAVEVATTPIDGHSMMVIRRGDRYWIKPATVSLKDALKAFGF